MKSPMYLFLNIHNWKEKDMNKALLCACDIQGTTVRQFAVDTPGHCQDSPWLAVYN